MVSSRGFDVESVLAEDGEVEFGVVGDFGDGGVCEEVAQAVEGVLGLGRAGRAVRSNKRQVSGGVGRDGEGDSREPGGHGVEGVGFDIDGDASSALGALDPVVKGVEGIDDGVFVALERDGRGRGGSRRGEKRGVVGGVVGNVERRGVGGVGVFGAGAFGERMELHAFEEADEAFWVGAVARERAKRDGGFVVAEDGEFAPTADVVGVVEEGLASFGLGDVAGAGEERVEVAVCFE